LAKAALRMPVFAEPNSQAGKVCDPYTKVPIFAMQRY